MPLLVALPAEAGMFGSVKRNSKSAKYADQESLSSDFERSMIIKMSVCKNCGNQLLAEVRFCAVCGTKVEQEAGKQEKENGLKKGLLIGGMAAAAVVVIFLLLLAGTKQRTLAYALYLKDNEVHYAALAKLEPQEITAHLYEGEVGEWHGLYLGLMITMSADGKTIFYPDKIKTGQIGSDLYYQRIDRKNAKPEKIDKEILQYAVNEKAKLITYLKGEERTLYQHNLKEKEKIDTEVSDFFVNNKGDRIIYQTIQGKVYWKAKGKEKERIDSDVTQVIRISEEFDTIYYKKKDTLYKKQIDGDRQKIDSGINMVLQSYDTGEFYYIKGEEEELSYTDYIEDDMKEADEQLGWPDEPYYPYWWDYENEEEYMAAREKYDMEYEAYEEACDAYYDKVKRDNLREQIAHESIKRGKYTLYYYDGEDAVKLTETLAYDGSGYLQDSKVAWQKPVVVYESYQQENFEPIKLSEIDSIYDLDRLLEEGLKTTGQYIAQGGEVADIELNDTEITALDETGELIYLVKPGEDQADCGELYQMKIEDGALQEPELYDSDVSLSYGLYFAAKDQFLYFKKMEENGGELYINQNKIDQAVEGNRIAYDESMERLVYYIEWDSSLEQGTLMSYEEGEAVKVADKVHDFKSASDGSILYLQEYDTEQKEGELYLYRDGKSAKVDDDVTGIIPNYHMMYKGTEYGGQW